MPLSRHADSLRTVDRDVIRAAVELGKLWSSNANQDQLVHSATGLRLERLGYLTWHLTPYHREFYTPTQRAIVEVKMWGDKVAERETQSTDEAVAR